MVLSLKDLLLEIGNGIRAFRFDLQKPGEWQPVRIVRIARGMQIANLEDLLLQRLDCYSHDDEEIERRGRKS